MSAFWLCWPATVRCPAHFHATRLRAALCTLRNVLTLRAWRSGVP